MDTDGRDDMVPLGINHGDVVRIGVGYVDFILERVRGYAGRIQSDLEGPGQAERAQIDHAHRVAAAVGDVSVLSVKRAAVDEFRRPVIPIGQGASAQYREK